MLLVMPPAGACRAINASWRHTRQPVRLLHAAASAVPLVQGTTVGLCNNRGGGMHLLCAVRAVHTQATTRTPLILYVAASAMLMWFGYTVYLRLNES
jgi:hypothetical protein